MKKILSLILAALIAATLIVPALAEGEAEGVQSDAEEAIALDAEADEKS